MDTFSTLFNLAVDAGTYGAIGLAGIVALKSTIFNNKQQQETLVTRFGKHIRTAKEPGLHFKTPFIDKIAKRISTELYTQEHKLEIKTQDELIITIPVKIQFEVSDPARYHFSNNDPIGKMTEAVIPLISDEIAKKTMHDLYGNRDAIGVAAIVNAKKTVDEYGINIRRIVVEQPILPTELKNAFNEVRASERLKEAARNRADAHAIEVITKSEADAKAQINSGMGAAGFRKELLQNYKGQFDELASDLNIGAERAERIILRSMELDAMRDMASHGNSSLIPIEMANGNLGNVRALQDYVKQHASNDKAPAQQSLIASPG